MAMTIQEVRECALWKSLQEKHGWADKELKEIMVANASLTEALQGVKGMGQRARVMAKIVKPFLEKFGATEREATGYVRRFTSHNLELSAWTANDAADDAIYAFHVFGSLAGLGSATSIEDAFAHFGEEV